ncbi:DUF6602 domain-containing protein [Streptomyces sp. NPDC086082]|uniref:DUF6602 domain-containing protein n=1 Tax=Streptomyces sp. NPDC086082 TaxID=3365750 RepID=UPI003801D071
MIGSTPGWEVVKHPEMESYFRQATIEMQSEYERIQARAVEDPGTAGDEGEENWAALFRRWLPGDLQVVTKGRILCGSGIPTDQVDIVVLSPSYPHGLLNKKMYLASEVLAVFECKATLKKSHIEKTIQSASKAKDAICAAHDREIIYGLVSHSYSWISPKKNVIDRVSGLIDQAGREYVKHPNSSLDVLCVADLGSWIARAEFTEESYGRGVATYHSGPPTVGAALTSPIGRMINHTLRRLSFIDSKYRALSAYFGMTGLEGVGEWNASRVRVWDESDIGRRGVQPIY